MFIEFPCKHCGSTIKIRYLYPGETTVCNNCRMENIVPGNCEDIKVNEECSNDKVESYKKALSLEEKQAFFDLWMPRVFSILAYVSSVTYIIMRIEIGGVPKAITNIISSGLIYGIFIEFGLPAAFFASAVFFYYVLFTCAGGMGLINFTWHFPYHKRKHKKPFLYVLYIAIAFEILIWVYKFFAWIL